MIWLQAGYKGGHKRLHGGGRGSEIDGVGICGHHSRFMGVRMEDGGSQSRAPRHTEALDAGDTTHDRLMTRAF